jgi:hypothetical protein
MNVILLLILIVESAQKLHPFSEWIFSCLAILRCCIPWGLSLENTSFYGVLDQGYSAQLLSSKVPEQKNKKHENITR